MKKIKEITTRLEIAKKMLKMFMRVMRVQMPHLSVKLSKLALN